MKKDSLSTIINNSFPRIQTDAEERMCVDEVRRRTSPENVMLRSCVVCGRLHGRSDLIYMMEKELLASKDLLHAGSYYDNVPCHHFEYGGAHVGMDGLVLDRLGFLRADEVVEGSPLMVRVCKTCEKGLSKRKLPDLALANGLWTGVGAVRELNGMTWIEEKTISMCHVSIQIQKCREVKQWHMDGFHPQRKIKGNISTFPVDPTVTLKKLPISGKELVGLVKVVFMSSRRSISLQDACRMRFFLIRRKKVEIALRWLISNNLLYKDVELDEEALSSLPNDGIPTEVYEAITFCDKVTEDMMGHSRYDQADDEEPNEGEI